MNLVGDCLVIVHAEEMTIKGRLGIEMHNYMERVKREVRHYLDHGKKVFFTRVLFDTTAHGKISPNPTYLSEFKKDIIWVPRTKESSTIIQGKIVREQIMRIVHGREKNIEFAGGWEGLCLKTSAGIILTGEAGVSTEKIIHNGKEIILYNNNESPNNMRGFAKRELIF